MTHAVANAMFTMADEAGDKVLVLGPAGDGRLLEVVVIDPDADPVAIHAMNCRQKFLRYLER